MSIFDFVQNDSMDVVIDGNYEDQRNPAPVPAGNYMLRVKRFKPLTNSEGKEILRDDTYPVVVLEQVEILEPSEFSNRLVGLWQNIESKPSNRQRGGSDLADIIRAHDATRQVRGLKEALATFEEVVAAGLPFNARLDWVANDGLWVQAALEEAGLRGIPYATLDDEQKKVANEIYNKSKLQGMKKFPKLADGSFSHEWTGPGGDVIEARPRIVRFYPSIVPFVPKIG